MYVPNRETYVPKFGTYIIPKELEKYWEREIKKCHEIKKKEQWQITF